MTRLAVEDKSVLSDGEGDSSQSMNGGHIGSHRTQIPRALKYRHHQAMIREAGLRRTPALTAQSGDSLSLTSSSADQAHTLQNSALVSPSLGNILSSFDTVSCSYLALCTDFLCLRKRHHGQKLRLSNHSKGLSPNSIIY